jgi:tetratricopeptide (TPR) repeat protein
MIKIFTLLTLVTSFTVYLLTLCPTVYVGDSGELITACYTLGIPHPPGYPTYVLTGKLFSFLPLSNIAYRINLMSAFFGSLTVMLLFLIVNKVGKVEKNSGESKNNTFFVVVTLVTFFTALSFSFSNVFWSQSVIAEVYTLNSFFVVFILYLCILYSLFPPFSLFTLIAVVTGISLGNHHTMVLLLPVYVWYIISKEKKERLKVLITFFVVVILVAFFTYLYLLIRSSANPPINWGNPSNIRNFIRHITRWQYGDLSKHTYTLFRFLEQIISYLKILVGQFNVFLLLIGILGLYTLFKSNKKIFYLTFLIFLLTSFGFMIILNFSSNVKDLYIVEVFFIPSFVMVSIWIGIGILFLLEKFNNMKFLLLIITILLVFYQFFLNYKVNNLSEDYIAENFGKNILKTLEKDSILFVSGDNATFILKYLQSVERVNSKQKIYDEHGVIFDNIYGEDIHYLPKIEHNKVVEEVQKKIALNSNCPVYFTFGGKLQNLAGVYYEPYGIIYRVRKVNKVDEVNKVKEVWEKYNLEDIDKEYYDYLEKDIIAQYHYFLGEYYKKTHKEKCILYFKKALKIGKDNTSIKSAIFDVATKSDFFNELSEELISYNVANDAESFHNQGNVFLEKGEFDKAIELYKKAISLNPKYSEAYNNLGLAYMNKGNLDLAIESYNKSLSLKSNDARVYNNLGVAYIRSNKLKEAITVLKKAIELSPDYDAAHYNLANAFLMANLIDEAISEYEKVIKITKDKPEVYNNLGIAYERKKMYKSALDAFNQAIGIDQNFAEPYFHIGNIYANQGKFKEAIEKWQKVLSINPNFTLAKENIEKAMKIQKQK